MTSKIDKPLETRSRGKRENTSKQFREFDKEDITMNKTGILKKIKIF